MPSISLGLPVYNGEPFLIETLNSILNQTFEDFELIISDNASTDGTQEICQSYMAKDLRIRYFRQDKNIGAAGNFNRVFELASARYFKWAAHDDLLAPDYLHRCVDVLDSEPSVVLCYPQARVIGEDGAVVEDYSVKLNTDSPKPQERFYDLISINHWCYQVFGVIRSNILRKTSLIGNYAASDRTLLAELSLFGRFFEIPERLFFPRRHPKQFTLAHTDRYSQTAWFDPTIRGRILFPKWRIGFGYLTPLWRAPLSRPERVGCYFHMAKWFLHNRKRLVGEVIDAARGIAFRSTRKRQVSGSRMRTRNNSRGA